jgi:hypothetical protein
LSEQAIVDAVKRRIAPRPPCACVTGKRDKNGNVICPHGRTVAWQ